LDSSVVALLFLSQSAATAQAVAYVYDELGRLIAVSDPVGDTAAYTYDAVGNVISIARTR
jgi:YD repeat-containing protein